MKMNMRYEKLNKLNWGNLWLVVGGKHFPRKRSTARGLVLTFNLFLSK